MGLTKETVLQAAASLADERGLHQVTLKELAARLNIKTPSLYTHVDGLQGLTTMLAVHGLRCLRDEIANAAVGLSGREAVHAMGSAYLRFAITHPGLYEATQCVSQWQDDTAAQLSDDILQLVGKVLAAFPQANQNMTHIIRAFRCVFHGFASLNQECGFGLPASVDQSFHIAIDLLLAGLQSEAANII